MEKDRMKMKNLATLLFSVFMVSMLVGGAVLQARADQTYSFWIFKNAYGQWQTSSSDPGSSVDKHQNSVTYGSPDSTVPTAGGTPHRGYNTYYQIPADAVYWCDGLSKGFHPDGYTRGIFGTFNDASAGATFVGMVIAKVPSSGSSILFSPTSFENNPGLQGLSGWTQNTAGGGSISNPSVQVATDDTSRAVNSYVAKTLGTDAQSAWLNQQYTRQTNGGSYYFVCTFRVKVSSYSGGGQKIAFQDSSSTSWVENAGITLLFNDQGVWAKKNGDTSWTEIFYNAIPTNQWRQFSIWITSNQVFIRDDTGNQQYTFSSVSSFGLQKVAFGDPGGGTGGEFYWDVVWSSTD
jgi:hypothetical protein